MERFRRITSKVRGHKLVPTKSTEQLDTAAGGDKYEQSPVTSNEFQPAAYPAEGVVAQQKRGRPRKVLPWDVHTAEGDPSSTDEDRRRDQSCPPAMEKAGKGGTSLTKVVEADPVKTTATPSMQEQAPSTTSVRSKPRPVSMDIDVNISPGGGMQKAKENKSVESVIHERPKKRNAPLATSVPLPKVSLGEPSTVDKPRTRKSAKKDANSFNSFTATSTVDSTDSNPVLAVKSVFDKDYSDASGKGADPPLQHVTQAPPLPDKRPSPPSPTQPSFTLQSPLTNGHDMADGGERLHHITQNRPRGPTRRPPSAIFKGNMRHSSGDSESSSLSIESPPKSNNVAGAPKLDFPPMTRLSSPQPPSTAKPDSSSTHSPIPSSPTPAAPKEIDQALSSIVLRANSGRAGAAPPSSMMPTSGNEPTAPSRSPMARPNTTFMAGANQSTVPWLQELNAKQQKRKSQNFEPGGKDSDPPAPPVTVKPTVSSSAKPPPKLSSSPQPQSDPPSAKQAPRSVFPPKQFGGSQQQQKPSAASFSSSSTALQQKDVVDSTKAPQQQPLPTAPASKAPHQQHNLPQSSSTASIQPEVELRRHPGPLQLTSVSSIQPDVQVRRTPSTSSQHSATASTQPDVQQLRKPLTEPDVISSASSSRKSSAASNSASVSSASVAAASATKLDGAASHGSSVVSSRAASITGDSDSARASNPVSAAAVVRAAHEAANASSVTGSQVSVSQAPAPSPQQPSVVATERLAAPAGTSSTTTVASPSPLPSTAQSTNTTSTFVSHPPKKPSNTDKASSVVSSDSVIPKDIVEDAKALDNVNAILNKLLPKVSALETRLEEQKREHTRQLNLLMSELDDERKKRACLEIEMERLRKMLLAYTTHV